MPTPISEVLRSTRDRFQSANIPSAQLDSEILLAHVLGWSREHLWSESNQILNSTQTEEFEALIQKRLQGRPVAYLIQSKGFWRDDFFVDDRVLVPRPETELIIETAKKLIKSNPSRVLDLGTGSGCLGLSLKREFPEAEVYGVDLLHGALEVAQKNSKKLNLEFRLMHLDASSRFSISKLKKNGSFDLIVANPPYIASNEVVQDSVAKFEPSFALYAADYGYEMLHLWSNIAASFCEKGHRPLTFIMEIGSSQKEKLLEYLHQQNCWARLGSEKDLAGFDRVVWAQSRDESENRKA